MATRSRKQKKVNEAVKVSVLMPAYNAGRFVKDAIDSVLAQDYTDFELIILDDASTDGTFEIIRQYKRHEKVRIYRNRSRLGATACLKKLTGLSRGKYLAPCDADDLILPKNIARLSSVLDGSPGVGIVLADQVTLELGKRDRLRKLFILSNKPLDCLWDIVEPVLRAGGSMIRKRALLKAGGFNPDYTFANYTDVFYRISEVSKVVYLKGEVYYVYRRHSGSMSRSKERQRKIREEMLNLYEEIFRRRYGASEAETWRKFFLKEIQKNRKRRKHP